MDKDCRPDISVTARAAVNAKPIRGNYHLQNRVVEIGVRDQVGQVGAGEDQRR